MPPEKRPGRKAATTVLEKGEPTVEEAYDPKSLDGKSSIIRNAYRSHFSTGNDKVERWVEEVYEGYVIAREGDDLYKVSYTADDAGDVTFGDRDQVVAEINYKPVSAGSLSGSASTTDAEQAEESTVESFREVATPGANLLESLDEGAGNVWRVTLVRPGISKNRRRYRSEVLAEACQLYEGVKAFDGHRTDAERASSGVSKMVGWHENVAPASDGSLQSDFHIAESAPTMKALFLSAWKNNRPDLIGFSHDVNASQRDIVVGGVQVKDVLKITKVNSADVVADPSAGGALERLVAGGETEQEGGGAMPPTRDEILASLKDDPALAASVKEALVEPDKKVDPPSEKLTETETVLEAGTFMQRAVIREALESTKLPAKSKETLRDLLVKESLTEKQIASRVKETEDVWASVAASVPGQLGGQGAHIETTDSLDKLQASLDGMFAGKAVKVGYDPVLESEGSGDKVAPFHSIKQAYAAFSGVQPFGMDGADFNRRVLAAAVECYASNEDRMRLTESIQASTWANALRDSMTKRAIAEYRIPQRQAWRDIVSEVSPVNDFRTQNRFRVGGYDTLATVGENSAYPDLVSPTDENATFAVAKRGGVDYLTMEAIANDDVGALRSIPVNMGRAAILTLFRAIFMGIIAGNPVIYDSVALFDAAHANTDAAAGLAQATYETGRQKMRSHARLGEASGTLGYIPRILITPNELEGLGFRLTTSPVSIIAAGTSTEPNIAQGTRHLVIDELTDANDWFLIADPSLAPTIEVGFYQGREDPEILVQDNVLVGSVFTSDVITYKVRHIWGTAVLDYRSFYRGQG